MRSGKKPAKFHGRTEHLLFARGAVILALALTVVLLRFYRLDELPPGISQDAGAHGVDALRVLQGEHAVFFPRNFGREGMIVYGVALATSLLGRTVMAIYLPTALASAGTVFAAFWLGQVLFDRDVVGRPTPWRALTVGGVAAGLLAVSLSQTFIGRAGVRANYLPLILSLCFAFLWSGWRQRSLWRIALAGACAGLLPYTYIPARLVPFLLFFFGLSFLPSLIKNRGKEEECEKGENSSVLSKIPSALFDDLKMCGVFLGCAVLVAAPILLHFAIYPDHFFMRSDLVSVFSSHISQGDPVGTLLHNVWNHLLAFGFRGDWATRHNIPFRPMLNPWEASFFWFGVVMAGWKSRRPAYRLLFLWLVILLLPAVLARGMMPPPSFIRLIGVVPAVYLIIGVGLWEALQLVSNPGRALPDRVNLLFRTHETGLTMALGVVVAGLVMVRGVNTYNAYFREGAVNPRFQNEFNSEWNDVAQMLNSLPSDSSTVYLLPYEYDVNFGFEYLYQGESPAYVFDARILDLPRAIESTLRELGNVTEAKLVQVSDDDAHVRHLLDMHGRYVGSDEYRQFTIHSYTDVELDRPWAYYHYLEPMVVHYDGGISLLGFALGQGKKQYPARQIPSLNDSRSLWVDLQWQIQAELDVDYAVSLRLHNAQGERVYQKDQWLLLGGLDYAPTSRWVGDGPVDTHIMFPFPPHLPAGEYELRLIVYNMETGIPTVEIDVWEPEQVLAKLRLAEYLGTGFNSACLQLSEKLIRPYAGASVLARIGEQIAAWVE